MARRNSLAATLVGVAVAVSLAAAQAPPAGAPAGTLTVAGDVKTPLSLTAADLKAMPRTRVEVKNEDGQMAVYEGVLVGEILERAGTPVGSEMRGNAVASYVLASASQSLTDDELLRDPRFANPWISRR
jgi:hypothetical protein